jgi:hypothetical protein
MEVSRTYHRITRFALNAFLLATLASVPSFAHAATVTITYTGQVYGGGDNSGILSGQIDGPFSGQTFSLTYVFNPPPGSIVGGTYSSNYPTGYVGFNINGGGFFGGFGLNPLPPVGPPFFGPGYMETDSGASQSVQETLGYHYSGIVSLNTTGTCLSIFDACTGNSGFGSFIVSEGTVGGAYGTLVIESETVSSTPVPPALPLFASGLAGIGLLSWLRNRTARYEGRDLIHARNVGHT